MCLGRRIYNVIFFTYESSNRLFKLVGFLCTAYSISIVIIIVLDIHKQQNFAYPIDCANDLWCEERTWIVPMINTTTTTFIHFDTANLLLKIINANKAMNWKSQANFLSINNDPIHAFS